MFIENDDDYSSTIRFIEGDYGITLPIELELENGESITNNDSFVINIYDKVDGKKIITKTFSNIQENTLPFQLTEQESQLLPVGKYYYDLDWYQNNNFLCNVVAKAKIFVNGKAGVIDEN